MYCPDRLVNLLMCGLPPMGVLITPAVSLPGRGFGHLRRSGRRHRCGPRAGRELTTASPRPASRWSTASCRWVPGEASATRGPQPLNAALSAVRRAPPNTAIQRDWRHRPGDHRQASGSHSTSRHPIGGRRRRQPRQPARPRRMVPVWEAGGRAALETRPPHDVYGDFGFLSQNVEDGGGGRDGQCRAGLDRGRGRHPRQAW